MSDESIAISGASEPEPRRFRAALIIDGDEIKLWQKACLDSCADLLRVDVVYSCRTPTPGKRRLKHALYYALNLASLRNAKTRKVPISLDHAESISFSAEDDGAWQRLPRSVVDDAQKRKLDFIVKFGMGLLRIPKELEGIDILSFHHGDPEIYRGRPAGFYEILHHAPKQGVVVQKLTNKLDAGVFLALGHFKIDHHSYRRTAERFYDGSRHVFRAALLALRSGKAIAMERLGPNYRLPSNATVARFALTLARRKAERLVRGAFIENVWQVALQTSSSDTHIPEPSLEVARLFPTPRGYRFLADPFFHDSGSTILAEGLSCSTHVGDIVAIDPGEPNSLRVVLSGGHHSYPAGVVRNGESHILPETAAHRAPTLISLVNGAVRPLVGLEDTRLLDATPFEHEGTHYLFAGPRGEAADTLNLYSAQEVDGPYTLHPMSPIVLDPERARMAGSVLVIDGVLYRLGQNNAFGYGASVRVMRISKLSPDAYEETYVRDIRLEGVMGPHTVNVGPAGCLFDFYRQRLSLLAGYRRLRARTA